MEQVTISGIFKALWEKIWLIILATAICFSAGYGYCKLIAEPEYRAKTLIAAVSGNFISENNTLSNVTTYVTAGELSTTLALQGSFEGILSNSTALYEEVAANGSYSREYTAKEIKSATDVQPVEDTILVAIYVKTSNPNDAVLIANDIAKVSEKYITKTIDRTSVTVVNNAETANKVSPNTAFTSIVAGFFGGIIVALVILLVNFLDKSIKGEEDFKNHYNIPILGIVPDFTVVQSQKGGYYSE